MIQDDFGMGVFTKVVHLDVYLDEVQRVGIVWFENLQIQGLKVVTRLKLADLTNITCDPQLSLNLI